MLRLTNLYQWNNLNNNWTQWLCEHNFCVVPTYVTTLSARSEEWQRSNFCFRMATSSDLGGSYFFTRFLMPTWGNKLLIKTPIQLNVVAHASISTLRRQRQVEMSLMPSWSSVSSKKARPTQANPIVENKTKKPRFYIKKA